MNLNEIKRKLADYKVGIAGVGGLGSNCAVSLVRSGIQHLVIADFDTVNDSNLNRQYYFKDQMNMKKVEALKETLLRINSELKLTVVDKKIVPSDVTTYFFDCDVIVEAFDDKNEKKMLVESIMERFPEKHLIIGSGMAGWGDNSSLKTEVFNNIYICGDQVSEVSDNLPPIGPRVGIVANMQANQVLEILLGKM